MYSALSWAAGKIQHRDTEDTEPHRVCFRRNRRPNPECELCPRLANEGTNSKNEFLSSVAPLPEHASRAAGFGNTRLEVAQEQELDAMVRPGGPSLRSEGLPFDRGACAQGDGQTFSSARAAGGRTPGAPWGCPQCSSVLSVSLWFFSGVVPIVSQAFTNKHTNQFKGR